MDFQQASTYLLSLGNEVTTMKLGLENIRKLLAALGDPQNNYLKVQVAGTNGKGSVCAFLNSICVKAAIKTGMFTSPHLISMTERVQINGEDISEDEFARLSTRVRSVSEDLVAAGELESVPTYFEQVTAIGLLAFAEAKVELGDTRDRTRRPSRCNHCSECADRRDHPNRSRSSAVSRRDDRRDRG
jgi:dihydrofolate synthase/folylpolyglutamate synthase